MKRHQIRRMIPGNISDAQLRKAISDLGLPSADDHNYEDEHVKQLLNQFKKPQQPQSAPLPTDDSKALTKQVLGQSTDALTGQIKALANRMDNSDMNLARQLAEYVVERPQRFTVMFAQELSALTAPQEQTFVEADLVEVEIPDLRADFMAIAPSSALGCLPM
jgi:hypothetical protein